MKHIAENINGKQEGDVWFTSLDMVQAYGQTVLHPEAAKHCNFQIIGGKTTGTYAFKTGYYGLTTMPPESQKLMEKFLHKAKNTFSFIDDILVVTKGTKQQHMVTVEERTKAMNEAGIRLKIEICKIAKPDTGYKLSKCGIKPVEQNVQAITGKLRPKNLKDLRSFMGAKIKRIKFFQI